MVKKKLLILIIVILIAILISTLIVLKVLKNSTDATPEVTGITEPESDKILKEISNRNDYYTVKSCIQKFYMYYALMCKTGNNIETVYNMLDVEYTKSRNINQENILNKLSKINSSELNISKMYVSDQTNNLSIFLVYGTLREKSTGNISDFSMMLKLDKYNKTFGIFLQDYVDEKFKELTVGNLVQLEPLTRVEVNKYNTYTSKYLDDEEHVINVISDYRENLIYNAEQAYEDLEEDYRTKRFPTFAEFEKYINNNIRDIIPLTVSKYYINKENEFIQYICLDKNNNYYIINEKSATNQKFILDTYTIDLPEFLEKYKESSNEEKVKLNIEKIKEAINLKDYQYIYNKTDETFRNNKFKNYSDFENYFNSNLFEKNKFEYKTIEQQASVYVTTITVKNKNDNNAEEKEIEIIMKLTETTDYYISFNFKK